MLVLYKSYPTLPDVYSDFLFFLSLNLQILAWYEQQMDHSSNSLRRLVKHVRKKEEQNHRVTRYQCKKWSNKTNCSRKLLFWFQLLNISSSVCKNETQMGMYLFFLQPAGLQTGTCAESRVFYVSQRFSYRNGMK